MRHQTKNFHYMQLVSRKDYFATFQLIKIENLLYLFLFLFNRYSIFMNNIVFYNYLFFFCLQSY